MSEIQSTTETSLTDVDQWENPDFPMRIAQDEDGNLTIEWDQEHPVTMMFNNWTEDDFAKMIIDFCNWHLAKHKEQAED